MRPSDVEEAVGLAVSAAEQNYQSVVGKRLDVVLLGVRSDDVGSSWIVDQGACGELDRSFRCNYPTAPIPEAVAVGDDGNRRAAEQVVWQDEVRDAPIVDVERQDHR
jgi:hypothetical protein